MNKQRKVLITITYNEMGIIIDTKAEEVAQPNLQPTCNQPATDCISRQAAVDAFDCTGELIVCGSANAQNVVNYINKVVGKIKALPPAQPELKWIPCSERLPEKDTCFYLATIANHGLNFTTTLPDDVDVVRWDYDRRKGHNSWHWCTERTVIAWMPLPEPYQEERREE